MTHEIINFVEYPQLKTLILIKVIEVIAVQSKEMQKNITIYDSL